MNSREKLIVTLNHRDSGKVAFDPGATQATGINAGKLYRLRKLLGRDDEQHLTSAPRRARSSRANSSWTSTIPAAARSTTGCAGTPAGRLHSCGSIPNIIGDLADSGVDCLNPIQTSAAGMDPVKLKEQLGDRLVFWGGCVDCQTTISSGTPADMEKELRDRLALFGKGGGLVCSIIHNVQCNTPDENILRIFDVLKEYR